MKAVGLKKELYFAQDKVEPVIAQFIHSDVYELAKFVSVFMEDAVTPQETADAIGKAINIIDSNDGTIVAGFEAMHRRLSEKKKYVFEKSGQVMWLFDELTDDEFFNEFSTICNQKFGWNMSRVCGLPGYVGRKLKPLLADDYYPPSIKTAVDYWGGLLSEGCGDDVTMRHYPRSTECLSNEQVNIFRKALANRLMAYMNRYGLVVLISDLFLDKLLSVSCEVAGISNDLALSILPDDTMMYITRSEVKFAAKRASGFATVKLL